MRSAAGSTRPPPGTAAAAVTRSTGSARSCAPGRNGSPTGKAPGSPPPSRPTPATTRSTSPGSAPSNCARSTTNPPPAAGHRIAEKVLTSFPGCPIPEIARLGRTLRQWRTQLLAYSTTGGASNGGTEAVNGLVELHRRIARGFRNRANYRLRMLLIGVGLSHPNLT